MSGEDRTMIDIPIHHPAVINYATAGLAHRVYEIQRAFGEKNDLDVGDIKLALKTYAQVDILINGLKGFFNDHGVDLEEVIWTEVWDD